MMRDLKIIFIFLICTGCSFKPLHSLKNRENSIKNFQYKILSYNKQNQRVNFFLDNELKNLLESKNKNNYKYLLKIGYKIHRDNYLIYSNGSTKKKKIQVLLNYSIFSYNKKVILLSNKLINCDTYSLTNIDYFDSFNEEELIIKMLTTLLQELKVELLIRFSTT